MRLESDVICIFIHPLSPFLGEGHVGAGASPSCHRQRGGAQARPRCHSHLLEMTVTNCRSAKEPRESSEIICTVNDSIFIHSCKLTVDISHRYITHVLSCVVISQEELLLAQQTQCRIAPQVEGKA